MNGRWAWWAGLGVSTLTFVGFLWYAYSGNFLIDLNTPLMLLRRDARGKTIRNRALVIAVVAGGVSFAFSGWVQYCPETIAAQQEERTITKAKREVQTIQQPGYAGDRHLAVA